MNSKRLLAIASLIKPSANIVDIGCDHGYLGIYLTKNNLCQKVLLTDVKQTALDNAIKNIKLANLNIPTVLSDGLNNIDLTLINTIIISGMGTKTIKDILANPNDLNNISQLVLQSNNNLAELRLFMQRQGYYLANEITLIENNIWYVISSYQKGYRYLPYRYRLFGLPKKDKIPYYNYLIRSYQITLKQIPNKHLKTIIKLQIKIFLLKILLKECR